MGCYLSKNHLRDTNTRLFRVHNVNDLGAEISPGKIEVTDNDLIFYQKNKEPIRWPLRCLRRYGFDEELFSFESGRRCPTGSGIYAFRCLRAEELFNLVQAAIQNVGQQAHLRASQTMVNGSATLPTVRSSSRPSSHTDSHEPSGIRLSGAGRVAVVPYDQHLYMNGSAIPQEEGAPNYVNTGKSNSTTARVAPMDEATALIDFLHDPPIAPAAPKKQEPQVTYADLDLPRSTDNIFAACEGASGPNTAVSPPVEPNGDARGASCSGSSGQEGLDVEDINAECVDLDVFHDNTEESSPNYMNVDTDGKIVTDKSGASVPFKVPIGIAPPPANRRLLERKLSIQQEYENVGAGSFMNEPIPVSASQNGHSASNSINNVNRSEPGELNYIEIDVNKTESENIQGATAAPIMSTSFTSPDSPSKKTGSYALIDFPRTEALSNTNKGSSENEEGMRKTRHNSTIT